MTIQAKIVAGLALASVVFMGVAWLLNVGGDLERAKVEKENAHAAENADEYSTNLRDCRNSGGLYNFDTGKCRRSGEGSRWLPSWLAR